MAEITLTINGRNFSITCDDGQEQRVMDLAHFIDARLQDIAQAGAAQNESHLLVLTALMLADEIFELRDYIHENGGDVVSSGQLREQELAVAQAIDTLAERLDGIANKVEGKAS